MLRGLAIERADQVWARDITNVPLGHDWAYLVALMDWTSRVVLAWRLSNTLCTAFCIEALEEALRHHGPPDIFNTDPGAQFTDRAWTNSPSSARSLPPPTLAPASRPQSVRTSTGRGLPAGSPGRSVLPRARIPALNVSSAGDRHHSASTCVFCRVNFSSR